MTATLSTLFPQEKKESLAQAVRLRTSCRSYAGAPTVDQLAALSYAAGRYALPGARLALMDVDDSFFTGTLLGMRRITGCRTAAALIVSDPGPMGRIHAGILGEAFVLEATAMGLGTCWVSGSVRKQLLRLDLDPREAVLCVICVGLPAQPLTAPVSRRRKSPEQFCRGAWREWPEQLLDAASLLQQAPSAMNMQPWSLYVSTEGAFVLDASDRALLEAGIALCHVELALETPHVWHYARGRGEPLAWAVAL